jgi:hypothetical protein
MGTLREAARDRDWHGGSGQKEKIQHSSIAVAAAILAIDIATVQISTEH